MKSTFMSVLVLALSLLMVSLWATPATSLPATEVLPIKLFPATETSTVPTAPTADVAAEHESHSTGIKQATPTQTTSTSSSTGEVVTKGPTAASTPQVSESEPEPESELKEPESAVETAPNNSAERAGECLSIGKHCKLSEECCTKRCHTYLGKCVS